MCSWVSSHVRFQTAAPVSFSGQPGPTYDQNVIPGVRESQYQASISGAKQGRSVHITSEIKEGCLTSWSNCDCKTERAGSHDIVVMSETKQGRAVSHLDCAVMSETKQGHLTPWLASAAYVQSISMSLWQKCVISELTGSKFFMTCLWFQRSNRDRHAAVQAMTLCVWREQSVYPARVHAKVLSTQLMTLRANAVSIRLHTKYIQYRHPLNTASLMSTTTNSAERVLCYYMSPRIIVYELAYSNIYVTGNA